jgi:putative transferase (TIGR04331 family)
LANSLNYYNKVNYPIRYWRIILGPWLLTYLSALWSRWESLRIAFEKNTFDQTYILNNEFREVALSYSHGRHLIANNHLWNYSIFSAIIKRYYNKNIDIKYIAVRDIQYNSSYNHNIKKTFKISFFYWIDKILSHLFNNEKVIFVSSYFKKIVLAKISLKLGQFSRMYYEFDKFIKMPSLSNRDTININIIEKSSFESFVAKNIVLDIPIPYVEGFQNIRGEFLNVLPYCEVIFSANSYYHNDLFKVWCAEKVMAGKKLIISEHGNSLSVKYSYFDHQEKISDVYTVWHKPTNKNQIKLPPSKIINFSMPKRSGNNLSVICFDASLYTDRHCSGASSSLVIEDYLQKNTFVKMLNLNIKKYVKFRPHHQNIWNLRQRYIDDFGPKKVSFSKTLLDDFSRSKVIVCTYPETSFFEAMYSGIPTILLYKKEYWEIHSEFDELIEKLIESKILFDNPLFASNHINKIWNNPNSWWDSDKVVDTRNLFFDQCGSVGEDWLDKWSMFFKKQLQD